MKKHLINLMFKGFGTIYHTDLRDTHLLSFIWNMAGSAFMHLMLG